MLNKCSRAAMQRSLIRGNLHDDSSFVTNQMGKDVAKNFFTTIRNFPQQTREI